MTWFTTSTADVAAAACLDHAGFSPVPLRVADRGFDRAVLSGSGDT